MLPEAELFVMAERMLVEVLGRIRPQDQDIVLPPMHGGSPTPVPIRVAVQQHLAADARLPAVLGAEPVRPDGRTPAQVADAACAAVERVVDGDALVDTEDGPVAVRELLLQLTVTRSLLAHYVAAYLGSTACPLPEELARPLWERTAPEADALRRNGHFREPMPLPEHVSWRDRFLLDAGHLPHPLGH